MIPSTGGVDSTRSSFRWPCFRISIKPSSISSYRILSSLPALKPVWKINAHKSAHVSEMETRLLLIVKNCSKLIVFLPFTNKPNCFQNWKFLLSQMLHITGRAGILDRGRQQESICRSSSLPPRSHRPPAAGWLRSPAFDVPFDHSFPLPGLPNENLATVIKALTIQVLVA